MKGEDPAKNTRNTKRGTREITRGNTRGTLKLTRTSHRSARSSITYEKIHDPRTTKDDTRVAGLLYEEVLSSSLKGVLNPLGGSSPVEARISEEKETKWMSKALTQNMS